MSLWWTGHVTAVQLNTALKSPEQPQLSALSVYNISLLFDVFGEMEQIPEDGNSVTVFFTRSLDWDTRMICK